MISNIFKINRNTILVSTIYYGIIINIDKKQQVLKNHNLNGISLLKIIKGLTIIGCYNGIISQINSKTWKIYHNFDLKSLSIIISIIEFEKNNFILSTGECIYLCSYQK